jgi:rubrerythrin
MATKTEENLRKAFAGESQARNKYTFFASVARKEGLEQIAAVFEDTANNEKEHAKRLFSFLKGVGTTKENLKHAAEGEDYENKTMYPEFEKVARQEGKTEIADLFKELAEIEERHKIVYQKLLKNLQENKVFKKDKVVRWKCRNCGYIHDGKEAPKACPACKHPQAFFELLADNY